MRRPPDGVTTAAEVWSWLQRHRRPISPQPWTRPAFRVVDGTTGGMSYLAFIRDGKQLRVAFLPAVLALKQNWRTVLAELIRGARKMIDAGKLPKPIREETMHAKLTRLGWKPDSGVVYAPAAPGVDGDHWADAIGYAMEMDRRNDALRAPKAADAGMRDTIAKLFPLPDYREPPRLVPTVSFGDPAPYAPGQAGPDVMMLGGMNRGSGKAGAILDSLSADLTGDEFAYRSPITGYIRKISLAEARDCDSRIYKKLIELGWTPPPGTTNTTKGE